MLVRISSLLAALSLSVATLPLIAHSAVNGVITEYQSFTVDGTVCGQVNGTWVPGKILGDGGFLTFAQERKNLKKLIKKGKATTKKQKRYKKLKGLINAGNAVCTQGPPPDWTPIPDGPTPVPTPLPDELSLDPYTGAVSRENVRYLLEKASFGLSSKDEPIVSLALSQGLAAAVDELMRVKPEAAELINRVTDRYDVTLGNLLTQARSSFSTDGYKQSALDMAINTENPFRENLRHFLLGLWTIGAEVLTNNPANNPQLFLWQDYWKLLGRVANDPRLPDSLIEVGRHPFMLLYLNNDLNLCGAPNENYARELMELFSLGPVRIDPVAGEVSNYSEADANGNRTRGDIYMIAELFTGWRVSPLPDSSGVLQWRSVYSAADHCPVQRVLFEGTAHAFTASNDEEIVRGIFNNHPAASEYIARELLEWYVTPAPPRELVVELAKEIKASAFHLDAPLRKLLLSKAFHHPNYVNKVAKTSLRVAAEVVRTMELARGIAGDPVQEVGVNVINRQADVTRMGYTTTHPPTVFFFPESTWSSAPTLIDTANFVANIIGDGTSQGRLSGWSAPSGTQPVPAPVLPTGAEFATDQVVQYVADRMGVKLTQAMKDQLIYYMNYTYNGSTYNRSLYDNTLASFRRSKGLWLYLIMAMTPDFIHG